MTPLQDKLRAALRETADEIPADAPPLRLNPRPGPGRALVPRLRRSTTWARWQPWITPLAAAALVVAVVAASLALGGGLPRSRNTSSPTGNGGVPPYYVAIVQFRHEQPVEDNSPGPAVEVRATATGAVILRIPVPKPYAFFSGVTAAADDRTFVLVAEEAYNPQQSIREYPNGYYPPSRFYVLHIYPPFSAHPLRALLTGQPTGFIPANQEVHEMALSPDGTLLAADIGQQVVGSSQLDVFNLATGTERAWSTRACSNCLPTSGGLEFGGVNVDALSWTADGQHLSFVWGITIRLLDTSEPGSDLLADSTQVAQWTPGSGSASGPARASAFGPLLRGAVITPDGRTVVAILEVDKPRPHGGYYLYDRLVKFSTATGQATATLNDLRVIDLDEQILYTNATGSVLVVSYARPGVSAGILRGDTYTPIPWTPQTSTAAW